MKKKRRRYRIRLTPEGKTLVNSIVVGVLIGGIAAAGAHESHKNWELQKQIAVMEQREADRQQATEKAEVNIQEALADYIGIEEEVKTVELTEQDYAEQDYYDSLEMLAILVEAEAGNQSLEGKRLVVDVVLNRVDSPDFPNTIAEVIFQENQFACINDGGFDRAGWRMQDEDYKAVFLELDRRTDSRVLYFTAGGYGNYGTPAYQEGDHYFCYE